MNDNNFKARIIGGIIIALIGFFTYLHQTQVNPVTGEKQHLAISPKQEVLLGLKSAPEMSKEMGGEVSSSDPRAIEVESIGQSIITNSVAAKSPWKFKFHLLQDTKTINAFALPGGQIFITLGLYDKLQTEAQLAGVLSHEIGHVLERHTAQQMAKTQLGEALVTAFSTSVSDPNHPQYYISASMIAGVVNHMFQLRYSREDESQADIWGIKLMEQLGYDPKAMIEVMKILKATEGANYTPEFFKTHPNPDLRIEQIENYLKEHPSNQTFIEGRQLNDLSSGTLPTKEAEQPVGDKEADIVQWANEHLPTQGTLKKTRDGFVFLKVDDGYINQLFPLLATEKYSKPDYFRRPDSPGAHVSVINVQESHRIGTITEIGDHYSFTISRLAKVASRSHEYVVLELEAPDLEALREKYGLPPLINHHPFHITIARQR